MNSFEILHCREVFSFHLSALSFARLEIFQKGLKLDVSERPGGVGAKRMGLTQ